MHLAGSLCVSIHNANCHFGMTSSTLDCITINPSDTVTASLMAAKAKGMSFADLGSALGLDEIWVASCFMDRPPHHREADKLASYALDPAITATSRFPKSSLEPVIPTDLGYRLRDHAGVWNAAEGCHSGKIR